MSKMQIQPDVLLAHHKDDDDIKKGNEIIASFRARLMHMLEVLKRIVFISHSTALIFF